MGTRVLRTNLAGALIVGWLAVLLPVLAGTTLPGTTAAAAPGTPGSILLSVTSARSVGDGGPGLVHQGDPVTDYKWLINVDDTGDPGTVSNPGTENCLPPGAVGGSSDPDFADTCPWPSIRNTSGYTPIVAQGDQDKLNTTTALENLDPGKYLISVTADGFKIDGAHFTVAPGAVGQRVAVQMNPTPLPLSTIQIQVYQDQVPVDATYEADAEHGLAGFGAHLTDVFGEVSTDYYGNTLCTTYEHQDGDPTAPILFDDESHPIVSPESTGGCVSDATGLIVIPNLGPNRYAAVVTEPKGQRKRWVQTTTLEGAKDHDIWIQEGETGLDNEVLKAGEPVPMVQFGFAEKQAINVPANNPPSGGVKGVVVGGLPYIGGTPGLSYETGFPNTKVEGPIRKPWVALSDLGAGDGAVYVGRGDKQGRFDIANVPNGSYQLSVWDDNLDHILWSFNVTVRKGKVSNVGHKMIVGWFSHLHGHVFVDSNENGRRDPNEKSVPGFPLTIRERDNSLMDQYTNTASTNDNGAYDIREVYPLGKWLVLEAFDTRYHTTGISYRGENERKWTTKLGGLVDLNFLPIIGLGGEIDWGVQPYDKGTNGGIAGTVSYDTTRNELDPSDAASEGYQPGIPDVNVHLYAATTCSATNAVERANTCRQGKAITPMFVPVAQPSTLLIDSAAALADTDGNGLAGVGETIDYTFTVTNIGASEVHALTVTDSLGDVVLCPPGVLAAGAAAVCTTSHVITQADLDATIVRNEASATGLDATDAPVSSVLSDVETSVVSGLDLIAHGNLVDADGDGRADVGETVDYTFTATNTGTGTLTALSVTAPHVGAVTCPAGSLAAGSSVGCTASYVVTQDDVLAARLSISATASATLPDSSTATSPESTESLATDRMTANPSPERGALLKGPELADAYTSETWAPTRGCTAYDYKGRTLNDQFALPEFGEVADRMCVEAPMMGVAIGPSDKTPGEAGGTVNGNYGFGSSQLNLYPPGNRNNPAPDHSLPLYADLAANGYPEQDLRGGDYIIEVEIPDNPVGGGKMYKATAEEDLNVFDGDSYLPQENMAAITPAAAADPPPGAQPTPTEPSQDPSQTGGIVSGCAGPLHTVEVTNPNFIDAGGTPYEGLERPSCEAKLVTVRVGQATAPNFNLFTEVPLPTHFWGVTLNDLGLTFDKRSVNYGEAQGLPFVPVGLYDYAGRLMDTVHTDFNGLYEALEPSTGTYNCPLPAGPCPNMYRFVGNDPGQPGALNPDYNPRFRTIAANFQAWPGLYTVTDEAPTQVASIALAPDGTTANPTQCDLGDGFPQLMRVSRPFVRLNLASDNKRVTIDGINFGNSPGQLTLGGTTVTPLSWSNEQIEFQVPSNTPTGARAVQITTAAGGKSVNGLTLQIVTGTGTTGGSAANPRIVEVGPGKPFSTIQSALEAARPTNSVRYWLVAVWPNAQTSANPRGEYTENLLVHHRVRLQGVGPGGFASGGRHIEGSIIDGIGFNPDNQQGADWIDLLSSLSYSGDEAVPVGAVITVLNPTGGGSNNEPSATTYPPTIDGFTVTGGVQLDFPTNINTITGGTHTPYGATGSLTSQGGGIYVHASVTNLQITDNVIVGNSGSYGGGVRVGTPYLSSGNTNLTLARNQIRDNGGSNLAGGVGIFRGSNNYQVTDNALCGNFSAEYGGALTAFGFQGSNSGAAIRRNRVWFNGSYDEGGGIMIAGELPSSPTQLSPGTGAVTIDSNIISTNLANDDGGGIRLLMTSGTDIQSNRRDTVRIANNTIADNISAHEGGGIALDDAVFVDIVNNTISKNLTTATAVTSDGLKAPAGISTATNSDPLQARLRTSSLFPSGSAIGNTRFSKPTLFNNVFFDNRAGRYQGGTIHGIGKYPVGTDTDIVNWDMGMTDVPIGILTPTYSVLQSTLGTAVSATNTLITNPAQHGLVSPWDVSVDVLAARTYPAFRQTLVLAELLPPDLMGDYHLDGTGSPGYGRGTSQVSVNWGGGFSYTVSAPTNDIDNQGRPTPGPGGGRWDAGSDQVVLP